MRPLTGFIPSLQAEVFAPVRSPGLSDRNAKLPKNELGTKRTCPVTGKKFYDLGRDPIVSPFTGQSYPRSVFDPQPKIAKVEKAEDDEEEDEADDEAAPELVPLEDAETDDKVADVAVDDADVDDDDDDDTFLEPDEDEDDADVSDLIDGDIEDDEES
jgi:uncharacterized protein (TIGR02300 family)